MRAAAPAPNRLRRDIKETAVVLRFVERDREFKREVVNLEVRPGSLAASGGVVDSFALPVIEEDHDQYICRFI